MSNPTKLVITSEENIIFEDGAILKKGIVISTKYPTMILDRKI